MKVAIYDTYVPKKNGQLMHFDVVVPDGTPPEAAIEFAKTYLRRVGQEGQPCSQEECRFCHTETATEEIQNSIRTHGFHIIEMGGCRDE